MSGCFMIIDIILIIFGLLGLFYGGDWLVDGASRLARSFGISALVVGLTVVAFGTSAPELLVSISAALGGTSDISIGNVIGSNIANIGLILGAAALVFPIAVHAMLVKREVPILIGITGFSAFLFVDGKISRLDGFLLFLGLIAFNALMIYFAQRDRQTTDLAEEEAEIEAHVEPRIKPEQRPRELMRLVAGLIVLVIGAQLTVTGAVSLARALGVSELVIGITLVAVGTSLPELATSVMAAFNKQSDIAIGNVVGSNIYNLLGILGITAMIKPISLVDPIRFEPINELLMRPFSVDMSSYHQVVFSDGPIMLFFTLLLLPVVMNRQISRREAVILLSLYLAFTLFAVLR